MTAVGDLVERIADGREGVVVRLGDEQDRPWWRRPVAERNRSKVQVRWLPSRAMSWLSRAAEGRLWRAAVPKRVDEQLDLDIGQAPCPGCGSTRHYGCGYDPETVRPAMSVADALSATIKRAVEESGYDGARKRIPGLMFYGGERPADYPIPQKQENRRR